MLHAFRENLKAELAARDIDMQKASTEAGLGKTYVRDLLTRREPKLAGIADLARTHGLSVDRLLGLPGASHPASEAIRIRGDVGAGQWHEVLGDERQDESPLPPDPNYPAAAQYDLVVKGTSINRFARDGERLRVVDLERAGIDFYDDDLVIFRRTKDSGQLIQMTAKRIRRRGAMLELWPESDDPRWQEPERIDTRHIKHEEGGVIALVLYAYNPARQRSRR